MATNDNLQMLARVKSLALAAMIEAGGKPCWVASALPPSKSTPPAASPGLTAREAALLAGYSPAEQARIGKLLDRLPPPDPVLAPRKAIATSMPPVESVNRPAPPTTRQRATFERRF